MFGFGRRRRQNAKAEALEIGSRVVERINVALDAWRASSLEMRRSMLDETFAERLVAAEPTAELSFEMLAEIEALALMKNWAEDADKYADEFMTRLSADDIECIEVLQLQQEVGKHIDKNIAEVTVLLDDDLNRTIAEAMKRRDETPKS